MISFDEWNKMDLRIGEVMEVEDHPNADKLYVLKVDFGPEIGKRTIVAGIRNHYEKKDLIGKKIVIIVNLDPVVLRGIKSEGMLLAASDKNKEKVVLLTVDSDAENGYKIS